MAETPDSPNVVAANAASKAFDDWVDRLQVETARRAAAITEPLLAEINQLTKRASLLEEERDDVARAATAAMEAAEKTILALRKRLLRAGVTE